MEYPCKKTRLNLIKRHLKTDDNDWSIVQWNKRHKMLNSVRVKLSQKEIIINIQKRTTNYKSVLICTSSSSRIPCNPTWRLVVQTHSCCSAFLLITQLGQRNSIGLMGVATGGWCGYIGYHGNME
jgi:hypothetical protein